MYKFSFINTSIYYGFNIVGTFLYKDKTYLVNYVTLSGNTKTIQAKTKKEIRKELLINCKRYK